MSNIIDVPLEHNQGIFSVNFIEQKKILIQSSTFLIYNYIPDTK